MRQYADLHLSASLDNSANARSMADIFNELDTRVIGLVVTPDRLASPLPAVDEFREAGLDVARRLDLRPRSREELLRSLRRFRARYEIVAVECTAQSVSRVAVRDRRVDIVQFPSRTPGGGFRKNLASTCRAVLEFNMSDLAPALGFEERLRGLRREIEIAAETSTPVIGSTNASNPFELRAPRDVAAVLCVLGLPLDNALKGVSDIPLEIVRKNRLRMEEAELEDGVNIVRRSMHHE